MKKYFSLLLAAAITGAGYSASAAVPSYDGVTQLAAARGDIANWMKYLPDDMYVAHVSIPGTHDTATAEGWSTSTGASYSTTQNQTIDEQLAGGIRAFDFRPGLNGESGSELYCNHGTDRTKLTLVAAMKKLTAYLDAHPSEFFVIHLFRGNVYNNSGDASTGVKLLGGLDSNAARTNYNTLMGEIFNTGDISEYVIDYTPYLKVKDIRGKIVVFRRDRISFVNLTKAGNLTNWPGDAEQWSATNYVTATNATNASRRGTIYATDVSSPESESELNIELTSITDLFTRNCNQEKPNTVMARDGSYKPEWSMIFTSGAYEKENTAGYLKNATHTNPHLTSLINTATAAGTSGPTGVVFSDWVLTATHTYSSTTYETKGDALVTAIIENNFSYVGDYQLDDELFASDADNTDIFEGKTYFLRNVATGRFLSSGATWGTHATAATDPIKIRPLFDDVTNTYSLRTTFNSGEAMLSGDYYVDQSSSKAKAFTARYTGNGNVFYLINDDYAMTANSSPGWADGSDYVVDDATYEEGNTLQQWEFITTDDYLKELTAQANPDNGVDLSFLIPGHSFRPNDGENDSWEITTNDYTTLLGTVKGASLATLAGNDSWDYKEKMQCLFNASASGYSKYTTWSLTQSISGLPNGKYRLSFVAARYVVGNTLTLNVNNSDIGYANVKEISGVDCGSASTSVSSTVQTSLNEAAKAIKQDAENYTVSYDLTISDGNLSINFAKGSNTSATAFFVDDFALTYYGPADMVSVKYQPTDEYDTLMLPFDQDIPEGLEVYSAYDYTTQADDYYVLTLTPRERIEAYTPYVVSVSSDAKDAPARRSDSGHVNRASLDSDNTPGVNRVRLASLDSDGTLDSDGDGSETTTTGNPSYTFWGTIADSTNATMRSGILTGTLEATTITGTNCYKLTRVSDEYMAFTRVTSDTNIGAYRAYICDTDDAGINATDSSISNILFEVVADTPTALKPVSIAGGDTNNPITGATITATTVVDIYTPAGMKLRSAVPFAEALNTLPYGIYIARTPTATLKFAR
jgi:hypothetical protein